MKRAVILQHAPSWGVQGQLANQLWNYISVFAYARERNIECRNYSFFEYHHYFDIPVGNPLIELFFFLPLAPLRRALPEHVLIPLWRKWYKIFVLAVRFFKDRSLVSSGTSADKDGPYYLPPSPNTPAAFDGKEKTIAHTLYFDGWLFRNPKGIVRYREDIRTYFRPNARTRRVVETCVAEIRRNYSRLIGVHIRQGDYRTFKGGRYFVKAARAREIIDEYLREEKLDPSKTAFIVTSDGHVEKKIFEGLNVFMSGNNAAEDLFIIASCDAVLGSDSSFGNFAAYYGNIPHIVLSRLPIDWAYYKEKRDYFENKYCTLVHF
ncbi:MAG: alpha-1,2-fucosyltransferase [bacterium]|nr:alpha-1,2-fucosyltransferase [bacterium]